MSNFLSASIVKYFTHAPKCELRSQVDRDGVLHSQVSDEELAKLAGIDENESSRLSEAEMRGVEQVEWAPDHRSPDYFHLQSHGATLSEFTLQAQDLALLAEMNDFPVGRTGDTPILFGLRGCEIVSAGDGLQSEVTLRDTRPTHKGVACVLGVWDRANERIAVFPGSTAPMASIVWKHFKEGGPGNILPTGFYGYIVGTHNGKPGCFLLRHSPEHFRTVVVRRSRNNPVYDLSDQIDVCTPGDNLHPTGRDVADWFSSWGCQVVRGRATSNAQHSGPWADYRKAAGLTSPEGEAGKHYDYMLLTGTEAMKAASARSQGRARELTSRMSLRRLRFGSAGPTVERLQKSLGLNNVDGDMGPNTCRAVYVKQKGLWGGDSDGIYSPALDAELGAGVFEEGERAALGGVAMSGTSKAPHSVVMSASSDPVRTVPPLSEYLGDVIEDAEELRELPGRDDYEVMNLGPQSDRGREGAKLWFPDAVTELKMPTKGNYQDDYPVGAIVHFTAGRCDKGDADAENTVKYGAKSGYAYFCISKTGRIYQTAPLNRWGSHTLNADYYPGLGNKLSRKLVGIEICNGGKLTKSDDGFEPWWNKVTTSAKTYYTEDQVRYVEKVANITESGFYHKYTDPQEDALFNLLIWLHKNNPRVFSFDHVLGHDEVAPKRKTDPGGALSVSMPKLRELLHGSQMAAA